VEREWARLWGLLRDIQAGGEIWANLQGTGFDFARWEALRRMVQGDEDKESWSEAEKHWAGMPEYGTIDEPWKVELTFPTAASRKAWCEKHRLPAPPLSEATLTFWWPPREREDLDSLRFEPEEEGEDGQEQ
jgi:hypothetical protein